MDFSLKSWFGSQAPEPIIQQPITQSYQSEFIELRNIAISQKQHNNQKLVFDGYITNSDVYSIVNRIGQTLSTIEIELYRYTAKDKKEIESGNWYELFRYPNSNQSWQNFAQDCSLNLCLTGDLFIEKIRVGSQIVSFKVLKSLFVTITENSNNEVLSYQYTESGKYRTIAKDDIIHIKHENPYTWSNYGLSPLQAGFLSLQTSNECNIANANMLANRGVSGIISSPTNEGSMSIRQEDATAIQKSINKKLGGSHKAGSMTVTSAQIEVHELGMSSSDLEIIRSQEITLRQLCRIYGANSQIFGDTESSSYNNMNEAKKSFYLDCVIPILSKIISGIENNLRQESKEWKNIEIEICTDEIEVLQEDQKLKIEKQIILSKGITEILIQYNSNKITIEQAEQILLSIYGIDEEQVGVLLKTKPKQQIINE